MSFFKELKRRNVFRVGIAYVIGAWLLLQLTDVLSELLSLPANIGPVVVAIVTVGFPIVLFAAWAFELTPEGIKREDEIDRDQSITPQTGKRLNHVTMMMLVLAVAYLLFDKFSDDINPQLDASQPVKTQTEPGAQAEEAPKIDNKSIAVLPFDNRSKLEDDAFFVEGIHDDLLTNLARIGDLKVISRTSVNQYQETTKTIPEIARELGVAHVMEGAVQRSGDTVRINVQLINAETDEHLWAEIFDRELTTSNLFAIQTEISERIAEALQAQLSPEEQKQLARIPTDNLAAYNAYLRGRQLIATRTTEPLQKARAEYERAVELDPEFALAWVGVADAALLSYSYGSLPPDEAYPIMQRASDRAIELDPTLGEAWAIRAQLLVEQQQQEEAERLYQKAIDLSPNYSTAYQWYALLLMFQESRFEAAVALMKKGLEIDPLSSIIRSELGDVYLVNGYAEQAKIHYTETIQLDPEFPPAHEGLSRLARFDGDFVEALRQIDKAIALDPSSARFLVTKYFLLTDLGLDAEAKEIENEVRVHEGKDFRVSIIEAEQALNSRNYAALREIATYLATRSVNPFLYWRAVWFYTLAGDFDSARHYLPQSLGQRFIDEENWGDLLNKYGSFACELGWVMIQLGELEQGQKLLGFANDYRQGASSNGLIENDSFFVLCHAALKDGPATLAELENLYLQEKLLAIRLIANLPLLQFLNDEPEFIRIKKEVDSQLEIRTEKVRVYLADQHRGESL